MILADEFETRQQSQLQRLLTVAHLLSEKTLKSFDFTFNPSINAKKIKQLSTCRFIEKGEDVFFVGPTGTGKAHLAKVIEQAVCRQYLSVVFYSFYEQFTVLAKADFVGKLSKLLGNIIKYDLLIIDDFAFKKIDQSSEEYLYAITDARYAMYFLSGESYCT